MQSFMEGLLWMISAKRRLEIGQLIRSKRKYLGLDQASLAIKIWNEGLSTGALQSRISRLERGESWADYALIFDVIGALDLWDDVLESRSIEHVSEAPADYMTFDQMIPALEKLIPNLREALKMLYHYAVHDQLDLFYRQIALLCDSIQEQNSLQK